MGQTPESKSHIAWRPFTSDGIDLAIMLVPIWFIYLIDGNIGGLLCAGILLYCAIARRTLLLRFVLLSPIVLAILNFLFGIVTYFCGGAVLLHQGHEWPPRELHPVYRLYSGSGTGTDQWIEPGFLTIPNNIAVIGLTKLLGPQRGAYRGPYPTPDEAFRLIENGTPVKTTKKDHNYCVEYQGRQFLLYRSGLGEAIEAYAQGKSEIDVQSYDDTEPIMKTLEPMKMCFYKNEVLLVCFSDPSKWFDSTVVDVFSISSGERFAVFERRYDINKQGIRTGKYHDWPDLPESEFRETDLPNRLSN